MLGDLNDNLLYGQQDDFFLVRVMRVELALEERLKEEAWFEAGLTASILSISDSCSALLEKWYKRALVLEELRYGAQCALHDVTGQIAPGDCLT